MTTGRSHRVLVVSYLFPPAGGVGVHRVAAFVDHVSGLGWHSTVLTSPLSSAAVVEPATAPASGAGETVVARTASFEPRWQAKQVVSATAVAGPLRRLVGAVVRGATNAVLVPDVQRLWTARAARPGHATLASRAHDVVLATGPPFSALVLGARLARRSGLPLVLDFRDEWELSSLAWENKGRGRLTLARQRRVEARCLRAASVVVATTEASTAELAARVRRAGSSARCVCVPNGHEPFDDAPATGPALSVPEGRWVLGFVGTLWAMADLAPVLRALAVRPSLAARLALVVAGRVAGDQEQHLQELADLGVHVIRLGVVGHREARAVMARCDGLLVLNGPQPGSERVINAKAYEYLASGRPVLAVTAPGELSGLLARYPGTVSVAPDRPTEVADAIEALVDGTVAVPAGGREVRDLERVHRAKELAGLLDDLVRPPNSPPRRSR